LPKSEEIENHVSHQNKRQKEKTPHI
jgi:hypothetical protein